jgi:hypothetical protein
MGTDPAILQKIAKAAKKSLVRERDFGDRLKAGPRSCTGINISE